MSISVPSSAHRPWPAPNRAWQVAMCWRDLLFLHWPVDPDLLRPVMPPEVKLDTFDGRAWVSVVPFMMDVKPRLLPRVPSFPELNVRTYVSVGDKPGVWFFSLDARSQFAVWIGRRFFHLPYFHAEMSLDCSEDWFRYASHRSRSGPPARFIAKYRPTGDVFGARPGTLDYFLIERYCLYSHDAQTRIRRVEVSHLPWPVQMADCQIETNSLTEWLNIPTCGPSPLTQFCKRLDVVSWSPELP